MAMEVNGDIADTAGAAPAASSSANTGAVPSALPEGSAHVNKQQSTLSGMPNAMPSPLPEASADVNGEQSTPSSTPSAVPRPDTTAQKCLMLTSGKFPVICTGTAATCGWISAAAPHAQQLAVLSASSARTFQKHTSSMASA